MKFRGYRDKPGHEGSLEAYRRASTRMLRFVGGVNEEWCQRMNDAAKGIEAFDVEKD